MGATKVGWRFSSKLIEILRDICIPRSKRAVFVWCVVATVMMWQAHFALEQKVHISC